MTRREIREEIFKLLFERELVNNDIDKRIEEVIEENSIKKKEQIEFLESYVKNIISNEEFLIKKIKETLEGWTYERLGTLERVLLKISFYEILLEKVGYEIAINEALEISKIYAYEDTKDYLNGVMAGLVKNNKIEE